MVLDAPVGIVPPSRETSAIQGAAPIARIYAAFAAQIGIGESHRELVVIVADRRAQQEWGRILQFQEIPREKSCAVVVQSPFSILSPPDIAVLIEKRKRVAVFQHPDAFIGEAGIGQDMMRIGGAVRRIGGA
jgi:hypothetical protein